MLTRIWFRTSRYWNTMTVMRPWDAKFDAVFREYQGQFRRP